MPLVWAPISERIGRRPVYLISALVSAGCALAGAYCHSYGTLMVSRVFQAIFISPPLSIGASTVSEMFFSYQKGRKMGVWGKLMLKHSIMQTISQGLLVLLVTCGPVTGRLVYVLFLYYLRLCLIIPQYRVSSPKQGLEGSILSPSGHTPRSVLCASILWSRDSISKPCGAWRRT